jgi:hypothetical protein
MAVMAVAVIMIPGLILAGDMRQEASHLFRSRSGNYIFPRKPEHPAIGKPPAQQKRPDKRQ